MQQTLGQYSSVFLRGSAGSSGEKLKLRDYQQHAIDAVVHHIEKGVMRLLVALPTGTGKTVVFAHFPQCLPQIKNKRLLVLAHREELLDQAARKFSAINPELSVGIEQGDRHAEGEHIVVASVPTLQRGRLQRLRPIDFGGIVIDEAHHAIAKSYINILEHFGCDKKEAPIPVIGFTATPKRGDNIGLSKVFDKIAYEAAMIDMIRDGYLSGVTGLQLNTDTDLTQVDVRGGEYVLSQLSEVVDTSHRNEMIVSGYLEHARERKKTLIFAVDVSHATHLAECFSKMGIPAGTVNGAMSKESRRYQLRQFSEGKIKVLTNCMVLTEGFDEPAVDCVIMARPTKSGLLYTQMIGRGTRPAKTKNNVLVIDCTDNSGKHDLVSVCSLFGLPPKMNCQSNDVLEVAKQIEIECVKYPWLDLSKIRSLEQLNVAPVMIEFFNSGVPDALKGYTRNQWVELPDGNFKLPFPGKEFLLIEQTRLGTYRGYAYAVNAETKTGAYHLLGESSILKDAVRGTERLLEKVDRWREAKTLLNTKAGWRDSPASPKQIALLDRMKVPYPADITKGMAATILNYKFSRGKRKSKTKTQKS